ncbi:hypothetical protein HNQ65_002936 [Prosthecobacter vanneervenii]|uniref:Uncharacterized protein n=1 Tax=Prosthecobacter vanneervenii TaxID=48466 RepID=A0A7W8DKL5_9BACT|nr:hypothetical protein [Prosthecobacter vanneervenii]
MPAIRRMGVATARPSTSVRQAPRRRNAPMVGRFGRGAVEQACALDAKHTQPTTGVPRTRAKCPSPYRPVFSCSWYEPGHNANHHPPGIPSASHEEIMTCPTPMDTHASMHASSWYMMLSYKIPHTTPLWQPAKSLARQCHPVRPAPSAGSVFHGSSPWHPSTITSGKVSKFPPLGMETWKLFQTMHRVAPQRTQRQPPVRRMGVATAR